MRIWQLNKPIGRGSKLDQLTPSPHGREGNQVVRRGAARWGTCRVGSRPGGSGAGGASESSSQTRRPAGIGACLSFGASCHCRNQHSPTVRLLRTRTTPQRKIDPQRPNLVSSPSHFSHAPKFVSNKCL